MGTHRRIINIAWVRRAFFRMQVSGSIRIIIIFAPIYIFLYIGLPPGLYSQPNVGRAPPPGDGMCNDNFILCVILVSRR